MCSGCRSFERRQAAHLGAKELLNLCKLHVRVVQHVMQQRCHHRGFGPAGSMNRDIKINSLCSSAATTEASALQGQVHRCVVQCVHGSMKEVTQCSGTRAARGVARLGCVWQPVWHHCRHRSGHPRTVRPPRSATAAPPQSACGVNCNKQTSVSTCRASSSVGNSSPSTISSIWFITFSSNKPNKTHRASSSVGDSSPSTMSAVSMQCVTYGCRVLRIWPLQVNGNANVGGGA